MALVIDRARGFAFAITLAPARPHPCSLTLALATVLTLALEDTLTLALRHGCALGRDIALVRKRYLTRTITLAPTIYP